jgi:hypothetical protein
MYERHLVGVGWHSLGKTARLMWVPPVPSLRGLYLALFAAGPEREGNG